MNTGQATRDIVRKSYDFALNQVGQDKDSGVLWAEYIQFLKDSAVSGLVVCREAYIHLVHSRRQRGRNSKRWMLCARCITVLYKFQLRT